MTIKEREGKNKDEESGKADTYMEVNERVEGKRIIIHIENR